MTEEEYNKSREEKTTNGTPSEELTARLFFMSSQSLQSFLDNEPDYFEFNAL